MKKTLISIVVLSMAIISLALTACSDKKDSVSGSGMSKESSKKSEKIDNSPNPESDFGFSTNDDFTEVYIGGYKGDRVHVVVPSEIQGVPVKSVKLSSQMIKSIVIPEGVISLRLDNCHFLSSIKLPNSLREVELEFLENLKSIELPEGLVIMEISATGITELKGKKVKATDLRAGAAMIIAGLIAEGRTTIENAEHILRGYDKIIEKLVNVGANIKLIEK